MATVTQHRLRRTAARKHRRLLLLEFNELSPALMDRFIAEGSLPNFRRVRQESLVYRTRAAERPPYLDPWIQWVTVHTGLNYHDHGVQHLNEGDKLAVKRVWDLVSEAERPVLVWGSMSGSYQESPCMG